MPCQAPWSFHTNGDKNGVSQEYSLDFGTVILRSPSAPTEDALGEAPSDGDSRLNEPLLNLVSSSMEFSESNDTRTQAADSRPSLLCFN